MPEMPIGAEKDRLEFLWTWLPKGRMAAIPLLFGRDLDVFRFSGYAVSIGRNPPGQGHPRAVPPSTLMLEKFPHSKILPS
jgi:hypothetical protein